MKSKEKRTPIELWMEQITRFYRQQEITPDAEEVDRGWRKIRQQIQVRRPLPRRIRSFAVAVISSAAVLAGAIWFGSTLWHTPTDTVRVVSPDILSVASGMNVAVDTIEDIKLVISTGKEIVVNSGANIAYTAQGQIAIDDRNVGDEASASPADTVVAYDQLVVPRGKHTQLTLSDGTVIHLNAGTRVIYPRTFLPDKREIYMEGEAYLQVAHLENHIPFVVRTNLFEIEVLGTSFNINAYSDDKQAEVVLLDGAIRLRDAKKQTTQLQPNQMVTLDGGQLKSKKHVQAEEYIAWINSLLILHDDSLAVVCRKLSRYYGVTIQADADCALLQLSGKLDLTSSPEEVLRRLSIAAPIRFQHIATDESYRISKQE